MDLPLSSLAPVSPPPKRPIYTKQSNCRLNRAIVVANYNCLERGELGYYSQIFARTNLPHRDPGPDTTCWTRRNGHACLVVRPGLSLKPDGSLASAGIPYGMWPRLLILYISTEAVRTRSPRIELGRSLTDFFRRLGIAPDTRRVRMLRIQAVKLFSARVQFSFGPRERVAEESTQVANQYLLWHWGYSEPNRDPLLESHVTLTDRFFCDLLDHSYPVDIGAIQGLRQSPLALDLFLWLPLRLRTLTHPVEISYATLSEQLGSQYSRIEEFARHCRGALRPVQVFWRTLHCTTRPGGIRLSPSKLPVPQKVTSIHHKKR